MAKTERFNLTYDANLLLKDAGAITADAAAQVGGAAAVLDMGADVTGHKEQESWLFEGALVVDVTAIVVNDNDELYHLVLEGADDEAFTENVVILAVLVLGATEVLPGVQATDSVIGRYIVPIMNLHVGETKRFVRMYTDVSGTTPSINYTARLAKPLLH